MKKILVLTVGAFVLANVRTALAVPVVPNFTQGSMTSNTETTSTVTETINSMNYNTGYEYVITGTNIEHDGDLSNKPNFSITTPGSDFQFVESYQGPGLSNHTIIQRTTSLTNHTIIQRTTTINSVTNTTSTFSN